MDTNKLQTSFIPKKSQGSPSRRSTPLGIFLVSAWIIFLLTVAAAGGAFAYTKYLEDRIVKLEGDLKLSAGTFDTKTVAQLLRLSNRLNTAQSILDSHKAVSPLFELIGKNTIQSVQFTSFNYANADGNKITISLNGKAPNFSSVALQSDTFSDIVALQNQIFADLALAADGSVSFKFSATVDPSALSYKTVVAATRPVTTTATGTTAASSTTVTATTTGSSTRTN